MKTGRSSLLAAAGVGVAQASQYVFRGYGKFANDCTSRSTLSYPQMIVDKGDIAEWNRNVKTRQVLRQTHREEGNKAQRRSDIKAMGGVRQYKRTLRIYQLQDIT